MNKPTIEPTIENDNSTNRDSSSGLYDKMDKPCDNFTTATTNDNDDLFATEFSNHSDPPKSRPGPPKCPPPLIQEMPMLALGPPPSYIPQINSPKEEKEEMEENGDDFSPPLRMKVGILLHKNSVRNPDQPVKHVTFGKLPRRRGDDPDPCLLIIVLIVFLIAAVALVLCILVVKGTIEVPCHCREKDGVMNSQQYAADNQLSVCPVGWVSFQDSCYGMSSLERRNYTAARESCFQYGGYLVSLESKLENFWFVQNIVIPRKHYLGDDDELFIGIKPGHSYTWESRRPFDFQNNLKGSNSLGFCYSIHSNNGTWYATDCALELAFYCERAKLKTM